MTVINLMRGEWAVPGGGAGVSSFAFHNTDHTKATTSQANAAASAVRTFFNSLTVGIPNEVSLAFPGPVDCFVVETGQFADQTPLTTVPASVVGANSGTWLGGAGAKVTWNTSAVVNGRKVRGFTYLVPYGASTFESNGTLVDTAITAILASANNYLTLMTAASLQAVVWSRTHHSVHPITAPSVLDKSAILRSRRD